MDIYDYEGNKIELTSSIPSRLKGKTWSVMGDSISLAEQSNKATKKYWEYIIDRNDSNIDTYIYGVGSERIQSFCLRYADMHYSDIITVFGGINDWGMSTTLGDLDDDTRATYAGSLNVLCKGLQETFPKSLIIFITPLGCSDYPAYSGVDYTTGKNSVNANIEDYADMMKKVCYKYKIPVVDLCGQSGLNPKNNNIRSYYYADGLHLNNNGHEAISFMIEAEINRHYIPSV